MGFKLRSGNGPLPFKQMGSSPAKQSEGFGMGDVASQTVDKDEIKIQKKDQAEEMNKAAAEANKSVNDKAIKIDESKTEKPKSQKIKIKNSDKKSGERAPVTKTPEEQGMHKAEKNAPEKKKGWLGRTLEKGKELQTKLIGAEGSEKRARFKDTMAHAGNIIGDIGQTGTAKTSTDNVEKFHAKKKSDETHKMKMDNFERSALEIDQKNKLRGEKIRLMEESEAGASEVDETKKASNDGKGGPEIVESPVSDTSIESEFDEEGNPINDKTPATFNRKNRLKFGK